MRNVWKDELAFFAGGMIVAGMWNSAFTTFVFGVMEGLWELKTAVFQMTLFSVGLTIALFGHPASRKVVFGWFWQAFDAVTARILKHPDAPAFVNKVALNLMTLVGAGHAFWNRLTTGPVNKDVVEAKRVDGKWLEIPFSHSSQKWKLVVPFDHKKSRSANRPILVKDGERIEHSDHNPGIKFYRGKGDEVLWE